MSDLVSAVYAILNTASPDPHALYVGSSINLARRWLVHRSNLRCGTHPNQRIQRAYAKYGEDAFEYVILERVADTNVLTAREQAWMDALLPGYNLRPIADSNRGWVPSKETLRRRSLGLKRAWADPEKRKNLLNFTRAGTAALTGKPLSAERRAQVGKATRAAYATNPAIRERLARAMTGRSLADATIAALAEVAVLRWQSRDYRAKFRAARKEDRSSGGTRHQSAETRAKISASKSGMKRADVAAKNLDPAYQERCRIGREAYWARKAAERAAAGLRTRSKYTAPAD